MVKKLSLCLATVALAVSQAATYNLTLFQPSVVNGTELKAGDYKLELKDNKATLSKGKSTVEAVVRSETADSKFTSTTVRYTKDNGKYRIQEIRLGGTTTKLVFEN